MADGSAETYVLVEGRSDRAALLAVADLFGRDLTAERLRIVATDGITNFRAQLQGLPDNASVRGLYDAPEERYVRSALASGREDDLAELGFHVCIDDLEDELIRALGTDDVIDVIEAAGDGRRLRSLQLQPAQRNRTLEQQLHRFFGARSGAKERYASLLVTAAGVDRCPAPLVAVLTPSVLHRS